MYPERGSLQVSQVHLRRELMKNMASWSFIIGLIGSLGNCSYIDSGYYYHYPLNYSWNPSINPETQYNEYHPPPRDLFECFSAVLCKIDSLFWESTTYFGYLCGIKEY